MLMRRAVGQAADRNTVTHWGTLLRITDCIAVIMHLQPADAKPGTNFKTLLPGGNGCLSPDWCFPDAGR